MRRPLERLARRALCAGRPRGPGGPAQQRGRLEGGGKRPELPAESWVDAGAWKTWERLRRQLPEQAQWVEEWILSVARRMSPRRAPALSGQVQSYDALRDTIRKLDSSMQYREYHTLRWSAGLGSVIFVLLYAYRDDVKSWFGSTSADITSRTLGDKDVQREAQNLAQGVVYQLLNDEHALRLTTEFLNQLLEREHTRRALLDLLASVTAREETQELFRDLFVRILTQPAFIDQASRLVQDVLQRESTMIALRSLFASLYADEKAQELTAEFFQSVLNTETFRSSVYQLGTDTTHNILNNEIVHKHAVAWINSVLAEEDLHYKAGDAIWGAITSTFIPGFLGGGRTKKEIVDIDEALKKLREANSDQAPVAQSAAAVPSEQAAGESSGAARTEPTEQGTAVPYAGATARDSEPPGTTPAEAKAADEEGGQREVVAKEKATGQHSPEQEQLSQSLSQNPLAADIAAPTQVDAHGVGESSKPLSGPAGSTTAAAAAAAPTETTMLPPE